jgi:LPXTG-site transpeptidase (sortase) family protein
MTLVDETDTAASSASAEAAADAPKASTRSTTVARRRTIVAAAGGLVVVVILVVLFAAFEGPVTQQWYELRQHQLAAQFQATRSHTGKGDAIGIMQVPSLRLNLMVAEGDSPEQLRSGPGHRIGTVMPGDVGNSVIVGHRHGWGGPFAHLDQLKIGDPILVETIRADGTEPNAVFRVISIRHLGADDPTPFAPSNDRRLTIITGGGGRFASDRLVITGVSSTTNASGTAGAVAPGTPAATAAASPWTSNALLLAVGGFGVAGLVWFVLRKRNRVATIAIVVAPLVLIGLLGVLLLADAALPGTW